MRPPHRGLFPHVYRMEITAQASLACAVLTLITSRPCMCKFEILIDRYTGCGHRQWLHYTGRKVDCDWTNCRTSPQHMHGKTKNCACPSYVEDIEITRTTHETVCSSCVANRPKERL
ncbi:hypothetical protein B0H15DRAFT_376077 [Mycena belliarum]|uniref:Uncharacterized protein n=1 Tax=Mycena belliarum TaxID=1033014 RepID=A0AAD6U0E6_9AGAR|nr:hypothetical protein B0H15DRAFT_376077 [Mycena belliae]